jgi:hypothetical protein
MRARHFRAEADLEPMVKGSMGQPVANPFYAEANRSEHAAMALEGRLLLTAQERKKHNIKAEADDESLDSLLG